MIGKTISHYRITDELGEGGMGVVYEAEHTRLKRRVALKFLPEELTGDAEATKRFIHEAQAASSLKHNHVCTIHDIDETPEGRLFISMDLYEGGSLKERIEEGAMGVADALRLSTQVADGLSAAHDAGIVHRDIKPANILLTRTGDVKIADFGLAKLSGQTKLTKTGTTVGTAGYMSPEQVQGQETGPESDVWSVGVMLYQMVTGKLPFTGEHDAALAYSIVNAEPVPMSVHRSDVPAGVQEIFDRCLAKNPAERYRSGGELQEALSAVREEIRVSRATPLSSKGSGAVKGAGRGKVIGIAAALIAIVAIILVLQFNRSGEHATVSASEMSLAVMDFRDMAAEADPVVSATLTELLHTALLESCPIRVQSPEYLRDIRRRLYGASDAVIGEGQELELARTGEATYILTGSIGTADEERFVTWRLIDVADGRSIGGTRVTSEKISAVVDEIVAAVLPKMAEASEMDEPVVPVPVEQITTASSKAYEHYITALQMRNEGKVQEAVDELRLAVKEDSTFALAYLTLAKCFFGARMVIPDIALARRYTAGAWRHVNRLGAKDGLFLKAFQHGLDYEVNDELNTLREILEWWPDDRQALATLEAQAYWWCDDETVIETARKGLRLYPDEPSIDTAALAQAFMDLGRYEEGYKAARLRTEKFPDNPEVWESLAMSYLTLGNPDSAAIAMQRTLEIDPNNVEFRRADVHGTLAYHRGELDEAITARENRLSEDILTDADRFYIMSDYTHNRHLPAFYVEAGRYSDAIRSLEEGRRYVRGDPSYWQFQMGTVLSVIGRGEDALEIAREMEQSDEIRTRIFAYRFKGIAQVAMGDIEGARATVQYIHKMAKTMGTFMSRYAYRLEADIALATDNPKAALEALDAECRITYGTAYGMGHVDTYAMLARAHQMAGHLEEAERLHKEILHIFGGHALSHYELGTVYEEMGRAAEAVPHYERFLEMWKNADPELPQPADARARLERIRQGNV